MRLKTCTLRTGAVCERDHLMHWRLCHLQVQGSIDDEAPSAQRARSLKRCEQVTCVCVCICDCRRLAT